MEIIRNSVFCRFFCRLGQVLVLGWRSSFLKRIADFLQDNYQQSGLKRLWDGFMDREDPAQASLWQKFLQLLNRFLLFMGTLLEKSLLYKLVMAVKNFWLRMAGGSLVFSRLSRMPLHRWFIAAFACYLPIEFVVRDFLGIELLASVWEELFLGAALVLVLWRSCLGQTRSFTRATAVEPAIVFMMVVYLGLMFLTRKYAYIGWAGYRADVEYMVWFFLMLRLIDTKEDARFAMYCFAAVVLLLCFHGIYQYVVAVPIPTGWTSQTEMDVRTRVFSLTGSPNIFGSLIIMAAPLSAALLYYAKEVKWKIFFLCTTGIMCLCDLFTFSRGSWVGLIVAIVLFSLFVDKRLLGVMGVAMAGILVAVPSIASRIAYLFTSDYSTASAAGGRSIRWTTGMDLLMKNSPLFGYGLGRFGGAVAMNNQVQTDIKYFYLDNYYLKTLVEGGYVGLAVFILLLVILLVTGLRSCRRASAGYITDRKLDPLMRNVGNDKLLCVGALCGLAAVLTHCGFENIFEEPYMMAYFWGLAAAMIGLSKAEAAGKDEKNEA